MKKHIRIKFVDFWDDFIPENNLFYQILAERYDVELSDEDRELYRRQAISEYKRECVEKMRAAEEAKAKAKRAAAKIEKRRQEAAMIPNLFE